MLIDGTQRFARATAKWLVFSSYTRTEVADILTRFPKDHVGKIQVEAKKIRNIK